MILRIFLTLASAGLFALCFPDGPLPLSAFVCLVPFAVALHGATARTGLLLGLLCGFSFWLIGAWWLANGFYFYVTLPWYAAWLWTMAGCLLAALPYGLFGLFSAHFEWMNTTLGRIKAAVTFTVFVSWYPFLFPGNYVHSLYSLPLLIQSLDLGGVPLLLFLVTLVNFFNAGAVMERTEYRRMFKSVLAASAVLALILGYGVYRLEMLHKDMSNADKGHFVKVVSIQPNLPLTRAGKTHIFGNSKQHDDQNTALKLSAEAIQRFPDAQAIIWPELPGGIPCHPDNETWRAVGNLAQKSTIPFIVNCYEYDPIAGGDYNKAQLIQGSGEFGPNYRKQILLPFGEYLPGERQLPWMRKLFPRALHYIPGSDTAPLPLGDEVLVIPTLCYEVLFPGLVRDFVLEGGGVIVNLVDDVWFGESDASAIHMALAIYRAVEFRVPLVRVTNSGNGVFVKPTGEIVKGSRTPVFKAGMTSFPLFIPEKRSVYAVIGDMFLILLTLAWGVVVVISSFSKTKMAFPGFLL